MEPMQILEALPVFLINIPMEASLHKYMLPSDMGVKVTLQVKQCYVRLSVKALYLFIGRIVCCSADLQKMSWREAQTVSSVACQGGYTRSLPVNQDLGVGSAD